MSADMTLSGDALSESLSLDALQSLKEDVRACFTDAFYLRLEDVEQLYKDRGNRQQQQQQLDRFLDVIIRRLRRITSIHA